MSFRKRGDVIGKSGLAERTPVSATVSAPGTRESINTTRIPVPGRSGGPGGPIPGGPGGPIPGGPGGPARPTPGRPIPGRSVPGRSGSSHTTSSDSLLLNISVRPSLITSQPTVSTGVPDLDKILGHQGLPTGTMMLVEESGTTDFSAVVLRCFASQGILHNRLENGATHVIAVGMGPQWAAALPGVYQGTSKERKKAQVLENEAKVSVANLANNDMKIAWRYGVSKHKESGPVTDDQYNHQFDITRTLVPGPSAAELSYVPVGPPHQMVRQIESIVQKQGPEKVVRIVVPNLLNPSLYPPTCAAKTYIVPLVHSLRALTRKYDNVVLACSLPVDLYPREGLAGTLESMFDAVIHLQPFNQEMAQMIEKAYKNEPQKIQHGLVNVLKVPVLSDRGLMMEYMGEYAFKNGRKRFEIEEWGIPVEEEEREERDVTF